MHAKEAELFPLSDDVKTVQLTFHKRKISEAKLNSGAAKRIRMFVRFNKLENCVTNKFVNVSFRILR